MQGVHRVRVSKLLITYPQCPESKESLLAFFKSIQGYECCVIGQEHHQDEALHLHAFFKLKKSKQMAYDVFIHMFDWTGYHPNIEFLKSVKDVQNAVNYCCKEDQEPLVDNCNLDALKGVKKARKYNTLTILETPMDDLIKNDMVSTRDIRNVMWAQQWWKLHKKVGDKDHVRGIWLVGPPGSGKSTSAREFGERLGGFYYKQQNKWWDGYNGEPVIILDDLDTGSLNHHLKIWGDKFAFSGEVKGGAVWLDYDWFIVTSNKNIEDIVGDSLKPNQAYDMQLDAAIKRRFHVIRPVHEHLTAEEIAELIGIEFPYNNPEDKESGAPIEEPAKKKSPVVEEESVQVEPSIPAEPSLHSPGPSTVAPEAPYPSSTDPFAGIFSSGYDFNHQPSSSLPRLDSSPLSAEHTIVQQPSEPDSLDEMSSGPSIHGSAKYSDEEESSELELSGGCEEGMSYSTDGESEPEEGEDC